MAGAPVKRVIGTLLFTLALLATAAFVFVLFANSQSVYDVPPLREGSGAAQNEERIADMALVVAIVLAVIALLLIVLLIVRRLDRRAERAAAAEAYYIPEEDRQAMLRRKREIFDEAFAGGPGPAPTPPNVKVYHLPLVPLAHKKGLWADAEPNAGRQGRTYPVFFPRSVDSGVYVNDYVQVDRRGNRMKLRTLLAGVEDFPEVGSEAARKEQEAFAAPPPPPPEPPAPAPPPEATKAIGGKTDDLPSDQFMRDLEARARKKTPEPAPVEENNVYYDFPGDNHYIEEVEGIGPTYGQRLKEAGVQTTARLCYEDPMELSVRLNVPTKTIRTWQATAELMKVKGIGPQYAEALARAGVSGVAELKKYAASTIANQVNTYLEGLKATVTAGKISEKRVASWQEAAKDLRRIRMQVPSE